MSGSIAGIVLAAGLSKRMGRAKLLIDIAGVPMLAKVVKSAVDSCLDSVKLVLPQRNNEYLAALGTMAHHPKLDRIVNPSPELGMASSLRLGLRAVRPPVTGAMIILGDQPGLTKRVIDHLVEIFVVRPERIIVPAVDGRRTTPVIFPVSLFPELMNETGDVGGRNIMSRNSALIALCEVGAFYDDSDFDTPEDLRKISPERSESREQ